MCLAYRDDILVVGYKVNGRDHDETVHKVLQRCSEANLKLNKDKCHFRCTYVPFFREVLLRIGVQPDPQKNQGPYGHATIQQQKRTLDICGH